MKPWLQLTPKPWRFRRQSDALPKGSPSDKFGAFRRRLDPASPAAEALRALRRKLTAKEP